ncbi:Uncharacterised protein [Mycobacterium tuberculosis]|uniref:Uncharacterized protein n=1 Tax=Mycobacterium tuberculosis TaxID=1773 RepID=A0A654ZJB8_MYCTX|nr:Uncharacterised protein [Mycobacterium tuberculosis]CKQ10928.1 Uncharacterised protein [Mycobacterium tuberculosis]CNV89570.1 Uncharacterised protein [Mycobacterium tuberculosis]COX67206.1 Uncharacterised protein [Mycobacterium tuberculosis]COX79980.1 Uncharacterised protein [Mycobacterium tuberculosis]
MKTIPLTSVEPGASIGTMGNPSVQAIGPTRYSRPAGLICGRSSKMPAWISLSPGNTCGAIPSKFANGAAVCCVLINCESKIPA